MNGARILLCTVMFGCAGEPLAAWRGALNVRPVLPDFDGHSLHAYYLASPESPDGRRVLVYTSSSPEAYEGEIRVIDRATGRVTTLARRVTVEDAHRAAVQQWVSGGQRVAFHDVRGGQWVVVRVDVESLAEEVVAEGRQLGFGRPERDVVPIYGPHFAPGRHTGIELLDLRTGQARDVVPAAAIERAYPDWLRSNLPGRAISLFFPVLSPDGARLFFKVASAEPTTLPPGAPELFRRRASRRKGLFVFDLEAGRPTLPQPLSWGHPAWHPDSRRIIDVQPVFVDSTSGSRAALPGLPRQTGAAHPSVSPDGRLFVSDEVVGGGRWAVVVGDVRGHELVTVRRFAMSGGARSWRRTHPHPVFSPDGRRIYFNVSDGRWSQLWVAERPARP